MKHHLLLPLLLVATLMPSSAAQSADLKQAAELSKRFSGLLERGSVTPRWINAERLWYELRRGGKSHLVLVDAAAPEGKRRREFSAASGAKRFGGARPLRLLPGQDGDLGVFTSDGKFWSWNPAIDEAVSTEPSVWQAAALAVMVRPAGKRENRSRDGQRATSVLFSNETNEALELWWAPRSGDRRSYGTLAPGGTLWQGSFEGHVFYLSTKGGDDRYWVRVPAETGIATIKAPSEDSPRLKFRATRPDRPRVWLTVKDNNLWTRASEEHESVQITFDGTEEDGFGDSYVPSPDGRHVLAFRIRRAATRTVHAVESSPDDQVQPRLHTFDYGKPGDPRDWKRPVLVHLDDPKAGKASVVPLLGDDLKAEPWSLTRAEWDADGSRVTFLYNERGHRVLRWVAIEAETGQLTTLIEERPETFVDYAAKSELTRFSKERTDDVLWMTERSGWNHLLLVNGDTGEVKHDVTPGGYVVRSVEEVNEEARTVRLKVMGLDQDQDPYHVHYARVNVDTTEMTRLTEGDGTHNIEFSPYGALYIDTYSRVDMGPVVEVRRSADGALVCELERTDLAPLVEAGWRVPERFVAKGRDGETDIWGVVFRPTHFDPAKSYPVIEKIYAGPHGAHVPKSFSVHRKCLELAELGFIVVQIDGMGTNWRSKAFHDVAWKNLGDAGFPDRIAWLRALGKKDPSVDLERVGIYGGSAGGQNALRALIAHGDFYKAAVADCGCHDNRMDKTWWNELWMSWPVGPHYEESSNVTQAHRMQGELLLIVGEMDRNVDPASTMQVVDALIKADKDFELLVMPGVGHGAAETAYGTRRRRDFFVRRLLR